jgi:hypothetical protein
MTFKLSFFRVGDRVQIRLTNYIGTVVSVCPKELHVKMDNISKSHWPPYDTHKYWRFKAEDIVAIVDVADGQRSSRG